MCGVTRKYKIKKWICKGYIDVLASIVEKMRESCDGSDTLHEEIFQWLWDRCYGNEVWWEKKKRIDKIKGDIKIVSMSVQEIGR